MPRNYSQEFRDRAVGLVFDRLRDDSGVSRWAVISDIGLKLGVSRESLRRWVNQAEIDQGERSGVTREESAEIRRLEAVNRLLPGLHPARIHARIWLTAISLQIDQTGCGSRISLMSELCRVSCTQLLLQTCIHARLWAGLPGQLCP